MPAFRILSGICVAVAGVLAAAALIWESPPQPSRPAGPAPHVEFLWLPAGQPSGILRPQLADDGSASQSEPVRRSRKHRVSTGGHSEARHRHRRSELANNLALSAESPPNRAPPQDLKVSTPGALAAVEERLKNNLSRELYENFELFLYVSKATTGPLAQHMYVLRKAANGELELLYDWPVSTGRESVEFNGRGAQLPSFTPTGYFKLDPRRFYRRHTSAEWREPMPFAMFFDWVQHGAPTGFAIHAATGSDIAALGTRASAGCVRLAPDAAETLFTLVRTRYRGLTPRFAIDHRTGTMSNDGIVLHDSAGQVQLTEGYKVLVVIENYGGENLVAAMY